jgi:hypothetical protein
VWLGLRGWLFDLLKLSNASAWPRDASQLNRGTSTEILIDRKSALCAATGVGQIAVVVS